VARLLLKAGLGRVRPLHGGLEAWRGRGFAVHEAVLDVGQKPD
jgi:rhodanese-related sulfurtransferase